MRQRFKIGDEVIANTFIKADIRKGHKGIIRNFRCGVGVEWNGLISGHDLDGDCENGKGWYIFRSEITKITKRFNPF